MDPPKKLWHYPFCLDHSWTCRNIRKKLPVIGCITGPDGWTRDGHWEKMIQECGPVNNKKGGRMIEFNCHLMQLIADNLVLETPEIQMPKQLFGSLLGTKKKTENVKKSEKIPKTAKKKIWLSFLVLKMNNKPESSRHLYNHTMIVYQTWPSLPTSGKVRAQLHDSKDAGKKTFSWMPKPLWNTTQTEFCARTGEGLDQLLFTDPGGGRGALCYGEILWGHFRRVCYCNSMPNTPKIRPPSPPLGQKYPPSLPAQSTNHPWEGRKLPWK